MTHKTLLLADIAMHGNSQPRACIDQETVHEYAERIKAGDKFPPVQVCHDGDSHWLWDGFHRVLASREAGRKDIEAEVREGTREDAHWLSLAANQTHGLRRTNADKERAVKAALDARPDLSDRAIADHLGVSPSTIAKYRPTVQVGQSTALAGSKTAIRAGRDGRTINTANIGKATRAGGKAPAKPPEPDDIPMDVPPKADGGQAPASDTVTDELGQAVEGAVADAFQRRQEIQDLMTAVSKVKTTVLKAIEAKDLLFGDINPSRFEAECNNVYHLLKAAMPYAACPYCRAAGCKVCLGRGWVSEGVYERAPKELKAS